MSDIHNPAPLLLLFSQDRRLAQTRDWLLKQANFQITTVYNLNDLNTAGSSIVLFLLCNSLPAELRAETVAHLRSLWPAAKILIFEPNYALPELAADEFFSPMDGPDKLIQTIRSLIAGDQTSTN